MMYGDLSMAKEIMADLVAKTGVAACVMHNKNVITYNDFVNDVVNELRNLFEIAHKAGVKDSQIVLDPGVGFAKDYEQNLLIIKHVDKLFGTWLSCTSWYIKKVCYWFNSRCG